MSCATRARDPLPFLRLLLTAALALILSSGAASARQDHALQPCEFRGVDRVVAVGDVHGAYDRFVEILQVAGILDAKERWSGGRAHLVQTGDIVDWGPDSRRTLDLLRRLEREATRAGGLVHALLGNHEAMLLLGDLRFVSAEEYAAFLTVDSEAVRERYSRTALEAARAQAASAGQRFSEPSFRERFLEDTPLGAVELRLAFGRDGEYGRWLRQRDTMIKINDVVFLHGGISPAIAGLACATINETIRAELTGTVDTPRDASLGSLSARADGPLWYRGLANADETSFFPEAEKVLASLGARAMVIGHTVAANGRIVSRFGGKVFQIDTGMLARHVPDGRASALEIRKGRFTAIYPDERVVLVYGNTIEKARR